MQADRTAYRQTPFIQAVCPISVLRSVEFLSRDSRVEVCVFAFSNVHGLVIVFRAIEVYSFKKLHRGKVTNKMSGAQNLHGEIRDFLFREKRSTALHITECHCQCVPQESESRRRISAVFIGIVLMLSHSNLIRKPISSPGPQLSLSYLHKEPYRM